MRRCTPAPLGCLRHRGVDSRHIGFAAWTVAKELGHTGTAMIEKTYGHLGEVRHRSEAVEYRVEQHAAKLRDRLAGLVPVAVTSGNHKEGADGGVSR